MASDLLRGFQAGMQLGAPLVEAKLQKLAFKRQSKLAKQERQSRERIARKGLKSNEKLAKLNRNQRRSEFQQTFALDQEKFGHKRGQDLMDNVHRNRLAANAEQQMRNTKSYQDALVNESKAAQASRERGITLEEKKFEAVQKQREFDGLSTVEKVTHYLDNMSARLQDQYEELQALEADPNVSTREIQRLRDMIQNGEFVRGNIQQAWSAALASGSPESQAQVISLLTGTNAPRSYMLAANPVTGEMGAFNAVTGTYKPLAGMDGDQPSAGASDEPAAEPPSINPSTNMPNGAMGSAVLDAALNTPPGSFGPSDGVYQLPEGQLYNTDPDASAAMQATSINSLLTGQAEPATSDRLSSLTDKVRAEAAEAKEGDRKQAGAKAQTANRDKIKSLEKEYEKLFRQVEAREIEMPSAMDRSPARRTPSRKVRADSPALQKKIRRLAEIELEIEELQKKRATPVR